ncbi:4Fe-4S dicluster domain-containing protein [Kribbella antibiotica]|uniref:ferredoxin--NADP(+) reductase n=1 Tax=Kribbella antibiotica TaxID=190195 RepID=A0A4R5A0A6_9ACTN|nr:FAD-dependent oxidoreductase [Kribbella antibiotica]TDD62902.1 4Fe-4S dicluster domain-containing protein [Kribbella antibiotica]
MPYAITQTCCADASCVSVCPVNCIHPTPQERAFGSTEMLYVDPNTCISCGACTDACPADAIHPIETLTGPLQQYAAINAAYFDDIPAATDPAPNFHLWDQPEPPRPLPSTRIPLRVAIVGTGPAGMYAAEDLLLHTDAEVTLIDRLPSPGGLLRYGVAPDHLATRKVAERFTRFHDHPRTRTVLGVEIGRDLTHEDLLSHHNAVIYAVGSATDRQLGIPGEDLPGSIPARRLVSWYNGHPEVTPDAIHLPTGRVVIAGTGNVALDVARILTTEPAALRDTEIAPRALSALANHEDREVVLLARRGPGEASYSLSELFELQHLAGVDLVVDDHDPRIRAAVASAANAKAAALRDVAFETIDWDTDPKPGRRIVLRFYTSAAELTGDSRVQAVRTTDGLELATELFIRSVGYRGAAIPGLPFDEEAGTVPNDAGRVTDRPGTYVVGWIKRGPTGGIGTNRSCAKQTVDALVADATAGHLAPPPGSRRKFLRLAKRRR